MQNYQIRAKMSSQNKQESSQCKHEFCNETQPQTYLNSDKYNSPKYEMCKFKALG